MTTPSYFAIGDAIAAHLDASGIPGLRAVTAEQAASMRSAPAGITAVVTFAGETVSSAADYLIQTRQSWTVTVMCRGATATDGESDGAAVGAVIRALHGYAPVKRSHLEYFGATSDYEDNARYYVLTFSTSISYDLSSF